MKNEESKAALLRQLGERDDSIERLESLKSQADDENMKL